jgi:hypothetical protein
LFTPLVSFGHCIISPSLIYAFLITPLVTDNTMTKRYQRGIQKGTNQRRTENTMDKTKKTKHYTNNKKQEEYHKNQGQAELWCSRRQ